MRLWRFILWDMKLQAKYGFYLLYGILTALYFVVLFAMPQIWREKAAAILIFSDPAAMGLFFMGAIVLLEKSQRVPCALAVSPVKAMEYIVSKVISLCVVALIVAAILAIAAKPERLPYILLGTALSSVIFTLLGIILATKITSLNQFILWTVPVEMFCSVPAILHLFGILPAVLRFYPFNACMDLIAGGETTADGLLAAALLIAGLLFAAHKCVLKMWESAGGIKL